MLCGILRLDYFCWFGLEVVFGWLKSVDVCMGHDPVGYKRSMYGCEFDVSSAEANHGGVQR